jgi:hypothetical protein
MARLSADTRQNSQIEPWITLSLNRCFLASPESLSHLVGRRTFEQQVINYDFIKQLVDDVTKSARTYSSRLVIDSHGCQNQIVTPGFLSSAKFASDIARPYPLYLVSSVQVSCA